MSMIARFRKYCASLALAVCPLVWHANALAQTQAAEPELKAAIIANMLLFVEWPADKSAATDPLTVCYLDSNPVSKALAQLDGKSVKGKPLIVIQSSLDKAAACHAIYFSPDSAPQLSKMTTTGLTHAPILLVGDAPGYLQRGIMINLEQVSGRIVFDIDLKVLQASGLRLSSKALRLARLVIE